jgi:hypothetical protein
MKNNNFKKIFLILLFAFFFISYNLTAQTQMVSANSDVITSYQKWSLIISTISTILICFGFYLTIYSLRKNHDWNRRSKTSDALSAVIDTGRINDLESLNAAFRYTESNETILLATIDEKTKENPRLLQILLLRLNMFEVYAIGISQGIYDEEVIKATIEDSMKRAYFRFKNFIERHREFNNEFCSTLEATVLKWEHTKKNITRRKHTA